MTTEREKTFSEFFAGIGLVHEGLRGGGWRCTYANDIDPKKKEMYEAHFTECEYYHEEDIWKTSSILERLKRGFLATASFPCTDLSLAGHYRGLCGEHSSTFFGFTEVLRQLGNEKPAMLMVENVTGFLNSHEGEDFATALDALAELGYWLDAFIVDAKFFVPQSRPRLFVLGFHERLDSPHLIRRAAEPRLDDEWYQQITASKALRSQRLQNAMVNHQLSTGWATVRLRPPQQADYRLIDFVDLDDQQAWWEPSEVDKHYHMMKDLHRQRVDTVVNDGGTAVMTVYRRTREGKMRAEVRDDGLAGCLRTPKGGSARQIVFAIIKGKLKMRWMSPKEYGRLQGASCFPLTVGEHQAMFGFGDAVCVPAIEWIDKNVLSPVFSTAKIS